MVNPRCVYALSTQDHAVMCDALSTQVPFNGLSTQVCTRSLLKTML